MEPRPLSEVPLALEHREELLRRMQGRRLAVFLDYDGTLTPIVPDPDAAHMPAPMRSTVEALSQRCPVAVVSGRDLATLRNFVQLGSVYYAGSHGFDIAGPQGHALQHEQGTELLPVLSRAAAELEADLAPIPGTRLERKRFSVAVHWRHVPPEQVPQVESLVDSVLAHHPKLRKAGGKKVFEVQPDIHWHKGRAVEWLLQALHLEAPAVLPLYVGDDLTDEDAFHALHARGGLALVVRGEVERATEGDYALRDTDEVRSFLELLRTTCE